MKTFTLQNEQCRQAKCLLEFVSLSCLPSRVRSMASSLPIKKQIYAVYWQYVGIRIFWLVWHAPLSRMFQITLKPTEMHRSIYSRCISIGHLRKEAETWRYFCPSLIRLSDISGGGVAVYPSSHWWFDPQSLQSPRPSVSEQHAVNHFFWFWLRKMPSIYIFICKSTNQQSPDGWWIKSPKSVWNCLENL